MKDILVPLRLEDRKIRQRQNSLRLLQQEVIDGDFVINKNFDEFTKEQTKVKVINGNVFLSLSINHIPEWLSGVVINGDFNCTYNGLTTLKHCPNIIKGTFKCFNNFLTSLEHCPQEVHEDFRCYDNKIKFTEKQVRELCDVKRGVYVVKKGVYVVKI